jgi:hypothetical protein
MEVRLLLSSPLAALTVTLGSRRSVAIAGWKSVHRQEEHDVIATAGFSAQVGS